MYCTRAIRNMVLLITLSEKQPPVKSDPSWWKLDTVVNKGRAKVGLHSSFIHRSILLQTDPFQVHEAITHLEGQIELVSAVI